MSPKRYAAEVATLVRVALLEEHCDDGIFPLLWHYLLLPYGDNNVMETLQDGEVLGETELQQFTLAIYATIHTNTNLVYETAILYTFVQAFCPPPTTLSLQLPCLEIIKPVYQLHTQGLHSLYCFLYTFTLLVTFCPTRLACVNLLFTYLPSKITYIEKHQYTILFLR